MTAQQHRDFCTDFNVAEDGGVAFKCSADADRWPWLKLHPANNIAVQSTNYYSLTGVSRALGRMDGGKWTALTAFCWKTLAMGEGAQHPVRGRTEPRKDENDLGYACAFFDVNDAPVYEVSGAGVVFHNRDFKAWRAKARDKILALPEPVNFQFAEPATAGVASAIECFVSPLRNEDGVIFADALVTSESGFKPAHPYHDGSGDHVNSGHLCDAAQQTAHLIRSAAGRGGYPSGGEVTFARYVELDRPFRVGLVSDRAALDKMSFRIEQGDQICAELTFTYAD